MSAPQDYFSLLGLPPVFDIDPADLEKRYFSVQRAVHPDSVAGKSAHERTLAISRSMQVNAAYETLKSPLKRAQYLLELNGIKTDSVKPSQMLLLEMMELRERLAETQQINEIEKLEAQNLQDRQNLITKISQTFRGNRIILAGELAMHLSYLSKISEEIRVRKKSMTQ